MILAVEWVFLISTSYIFSGQIAYLAISVGWNYVGMQWGDRAIMIGSATGTAVAMNLIEILPKFLSWLFIASEDIGGNFSNFSIIFY